MSVLERPFGSGAYAAPIPTLDANLDPMAHAMARRLTRIPVSQGVGHAMQGLGNSSGNPGQKGKRGGTPLKQICKGQETRATTAGPSGETVGASEASDEPRTGGQVAPDATHHQT